MSDDNLTDEALADLYAKALAAQALPPQAPPGKAEEHRAILAAFQSAASPDAVLALIDEVREQREDERKRANNFEWLAKARREGKAVSLGRSNWALPPQLKGDPEK